MEKKTKKGADEERDGEEPTYSLQNRELLGNSGAFRMHGAQTTRGMKSIA